MKFSGIQLWPGEIEKRNLTNSALVRKIKQLIIWRTVRGAVIGNSLHGDRTIGVYNELDISCFYEVGATQILL